MTLYLLHIKNQIPGGCSPSKIKTLWKISSDKALLERLARKEFYDTNRQLFFDMKIKTVEDYVYQWRDLDEGHTLPPPFFAQISPVEDGLCHNSKKKVETIPLDLFVFYSRLLNEKDNAQHFLIYDFKCLISKKESAWSPFLLSKDLYVCPEFVQMRTKVEPEFIKEKFKDFSKQQIKSFKNWLIEGKPSKYQKKDRNNLKLIFKQLGVNDWEKLCIRSQLRELYKDEKSMDFIIKIQKEDDDDDDDDDEDEQEEKKIEIKFHKWVLVARTGLFKEFFGTLQNEENVSDYSQRSEQFWIFFKKFLYTGVFDFLAIPKSQFEEFQDANQYYNLSEKCNWAKLCKIYQKLLDFDKKKIIRAWLDDDNQNPKFDNKEWSEIDSTHKKWIKSYWDLSKRRKQSVKSTAKKKRKKN
ncbi:hypothetical protein M0812_04170 [Anaeramoeba flamelloides]|uniref:BTB domain-containing protein n=1 Tax=Anaeramoeba flamelloides TaxID=1746091 RepID=A0AAV8AJ23_9EUKA|nr:hypothetical protein M0812_04170 [Anaeramoeba flamelloides]